MSPKLLRRFISGSLALAFVIHTCRAQGATFPTTLTTTALDRSSSGWFAAAACTATAEGHQTHSGPAPPSLVQHRIQRLGLLHPASFNVRVRTNRQSRERRVVAHRAAATDQRGVALWHELGCDAGADLRSRWCLPIAWLARQQAPRRCRSYARAGASSSPPTSSRLDDEEG